MNAGQRIRAVGKRRGLGKEGTEHPATGWLATRGGLVVGLLLVGKRLATLEQASSAGEPRRARAARGGCDSTLVGGLYARRAAGAGGLDGKRAVSAR